jgi:DNA-binding response OmpR family regulator
MARILIVDDEARIVDVVRAYLAREGHDVVTAGDGEAAVDLARSVRPDLVILDVMLPKRSGFDVLRDLRTGAWRGAVIMLTARDDVIDRVAGLELGADDYVTKPFEPRELVARVGAVLRRSHGAAAEAPAPANEIPAGTRRTRFFDLEIDEGAREVRRAAGRIDLTRVEFDLLLALSRQPGLVLTREQLGAQVFGETFDAFDRTIDSHIKNLRHKLGERPDAGQYVETVRGVGYRGARP